MSTTKGSPLVSVVIPAYNRAEFIVPTVRSVLEQSCGGAVGVEVIVVDDASTDGTPEILAKAFGGSIRILSNPRNLERGACRNRGVRVSRGTFVAFLDSDDVWAPQKLERQLDVMASGQVVLTDVFLIDDAGRSTGQLRRPSQLTAADLCTESFFGSPSSLLLHRSAFERVGGFPEELWVQGAEDWVFLNLLRSAGYGFRVLPEPLVGYRVHGGNDTGNPERVAETYQAALRWMADHGLLVGHDLERARTARAVSLARQFAVAGRVRPAWRWVREARRAGGSRAAIRASAYVGGHLVVRAWRRL